MTLNFQKIVRAAFAVETLTIKHALSEGCVSRYATGRASRTSHVRGHFAQRNPLLEEYVYVSVLSVRCRVAGVSKREHLSGKECGAFV